jgi:hypothetical protein
MMYGFSPPGEYLNHPSILEHIDHGQNTPKLGLVILPFWVI